MPVEKHAIIEFYSEPTEDAKASMEAGRPIYTDQEMVWIRIVGDPTRDFRGYAHEKSIMARGVGGGFISYAERYPDHYALFKQQQVSFEAGTPLEMLPFLRPARIAELKVRNILTAENLANLSDRFIAENGPNTRNEIAMTKAWLDQAEQANQVALKAAENQVLNDRIAALEMALSQKSGGVETWDNDRLRALLGEHGITPRANASRESLVEAARSVMADA
jgi:hypothetical protein